MSQSLTIKLNQSEMKRLSQLALRFGLSLPEFTRSVLVELEEAFDSESFEDYDDPQVLKESLNRAVADWHSSRVRTRL